MAIELQQEQGIFGPDQMADAPQESMTLSPEERTGELMTRFRYAESWRNQFDAKAVEWYRIYVGHRYPLPKEKQGRSNLHIPRTYEIVDTIRARFVRSFFNTRPYLDFLPLPIRGGDPQELDFRAQQAVLAASLVDEQLDRNKIKAVFYNFITSLLVFPAAILSVGWKYDVRTVKRMVEEPIFARDPASGTPLLDPMGQPVVVDMRRELEETEEVVWDDNEIKNVDFFDFWPDPRGQDIDSCRFVFQREWLTEEQIADKLMVLEEAGLGEVFPLNWEGLRGAAEGLEEGRNERLSAVGISPETQEGHWSEHDPQEQRRGRLHEVLHYWEDQRHAMLINRTALAYEGESPYWRHGRKPFVVASYDPLPNEIYGLSAVQLIHHLNEELNTNRNQRVDTVSFVLNRMWKVRRSADIEDDQLVSRPHGIIEVNEPDDVTEVAMSDIPTSAYTDEQVIKLDMENVPGVPSIVRGVDPPRSETATEIATKSSAAGMRFDVKILLFETLSIKRLAMLMDLNNQQFIDAPRVLRLFGVDAAVQWINVAPGQLVGEFDYRPSGANVDPGANKEIRREQLNQMMATILSTGNPYIDTYELTKMWLESFDVRNVERLLIPRDVVQQMMAQQQAQQMEHEQVVAGRDRDPGRQPSQPPQQPL